MHSERDKLKGGPVAGITGDIHQQTHLVSEWSELLQQMFQSKTERDDDDKAAAIRSQRNTKWEENPSELLQHVARNPESFTLWCAKTHTNNPI